MALTPHCGPDDVITPIMAEDERTRVINGVVQARNYADKETESAFAAAITKGDDSQANAIIQRLPRSGNFYNHMPAALAKARLPPEFWSKAFKFAVERHPYEKAVSWAYFTLGTSRRSVFDFPAFLNSSMRRLDDTACYLIDGTVAVDRLVRFESLDSELAEIFELIGLPPQKLPRAKGQYRLDRRAARDILTPDQKRLVFAASRKTFDLLGYLP